MWIARTERPGARPDTGRRFVQLDHEVADGDGIDTDGTEEYKVQVFHTPGHSAGFGYRPVQEEGALFCGDAIPVEGDLPSMTMPIIRAIGNKTAGNPGDPTSPSAWDEPRENDAVYQQMDRALAYLQRIHEAVIAVSADGTHDPIEIAKKLLRSWAAPQGCIPAQIYLAANIRVQDQPDLAAAT